MLKFTFMLLSFIYCFEGLIGDEFLTDEIDRDLQEALSPLDGLGEGIHQTVQNSLKPLEGIGERIQKTVQNSLKPLNGLGERIQKTVADAVKPALILGAKQKVKSGGDGVTIATYHLRNDESSDLLFKNGLAYQCSGSVSHKTSACNGKLTIKTYENPEDYCFKNPNAVINNVLCFSQDDTGLSVSSINGAITCKTRENKDAYTITAEAHKQLCSSKIDFIDYKYFTQHHFENPDNAINCENRKGWTICTLSEKWNSDAVTNIYSTGNSVIVS